MFCKCAGSLFQRVGAAVVRDLSPASAFRSRALGWRSSKPPLDLRLYFDTSLTLIRSLMYSGARPWIALKVRISILKQIRYWTGSVKNTALECCNSSSTSDCQASLLTTHRCKIFFHWKFNEIAVSIFGFEYWPLFSNNPVSALALDLHKSSDISSFMHVSVN